MPLGDWLATSRTGPLDLSRMRIATPRMSVAGPTAAPRPRPWSQRVFGEGESGVAPPEDWDEVKQRVSSREPQVQGVVASYAEFLHKPHSIKGIRRHSSWLTQRSRLAMSS